MTPDTSAIEAERDAARAEVARLRYALRTMVYEATSLSAERDDGSHWCRITAVTLARARAALTESAAPATPTSTPETEG